LADDQTLNVRDLSETDARPVPGTSEPFATSEPAFSPDGQSLAYVHVVLGTGPYVIKRIPVSGGAPVAVYEAPTVREYPRGLSWPEPDTLLFANHQGVVRLSANGGTPEVLVPRGDGESFFSPQLLPGGKSVLFTRVPGTGERLPYDQGEIVVATIGATDRQVVWSGGSAARYLPSGHLLFVQRDALFAIAFDADARAVRGGPVPLVQGLRRPTGANASDAANYAVSETGTLAMIPAAAGAAAPVERVMITPTWVDRSGREEPLAVRPDSYTVARISPDGTKIALVIGARGSRIQLPAIWLYDLRTENLSLLATEPAIHDSPVWDADNRRIYFRALRLNEQGTPVRGDVYSIELETGDITLLGESTPDFPITIPWAVIPGGETLVLINARTLQDAGLATLSLSSRQFGRLLEDKGIQIDPAFSPDGTWFAYSDTTRSQTGFEVSLRPFPGVTRTIIAVGSGQQPVFSRDGTELFFHDDKGIAVAPVSYAPTVRIGRARNLFTGAYAWGEFGRAWDLDPSGQRFLMIPSPGTPTRTPDGAVLDESERPRIDVVVNWVKELESRVPAVR
jgi:Tol biopolymer transport system component